MRRSTRTKRLRRAHRTGGGAGGRRRRSAEARSATAATDLHLEQFYRRGQAAALAVAAREYVVARRASYLATRVLGLFPVLVAVAECIGPASAPTIRCVSRVWRAATDFAFGGPPCTPGFPHALARRTVLAHVRAFWLITLPDPRLQNYEFALQGCPWQPWSAPWRWSARGHPIWVNAIIVDPVVHEPPCRRRYPPRPTAPPAYRAPLRGR
jgi:hypothetical protein